MQNPAFPPIEDLLVHAPFVRAVATAAVYGDDAVDDVVQATWLAAMERPPRHGKSVRGWLATVARNVARGRGRAESRRQRREQGQGPRDPVPSAADIAAREEIRRKLLAAVLELDAPSRDALLLRYYENLPPRQVAARLGVPVETARTRIKRGLARLRTRLDEDWDGDRRAWAVLVAPLAGGGAGLAGTATATAVGTGLLLKAAAAVLLVGVTVATIHAVRNDADRPAPALDAAADDERNGNGNPPVADARLRPAPVVARAAARGRGRIHGEIVPNATVPGVRIEATRVASLESFRAYDLASRLAGMFRIFEPTDDPDATASLRADGTFTLSGLAAGVYVVRAVHPDGFTRARSAILPNDGAQASLRLDVTRGEHTLRGRVLDSTGRAVRARILASEGRVGMATVLLPSGPLPTTTDTHGRFAVAHLPAGRYVVTAVAGGRTLYRRFDVEVPQADVLEIVLGRSERLEGFVVDAATDAPIAHAKVLYHAEQDEGDGGGEIGVVVSDTAGRFAVPDLGEKMGFFASAPGYPGRQMARRGDDAPTLRLDRGMAVEGTVRTQAGEPVADVTVRAGKWSSHRPMSSALATVRTDGAGRYRIDGLEAGEVVLFAWGEGWVSEAMLTLGTGGGGPLVLEGTPGETIAVDLVAVRTARVTGRVLDAAGKGAAGAAVSVRPEAAGRAGPGTQPVNEAPVFTDDGGHFSLDTVLPGSGNRVLARAANGVEAKSEPFTAESGTVHDVEIRLPEPRSLEVVVVDEEAQPVRGATVFLGIRERNRTTRHAVADAGGMLTTGADGTLTVPALPAGPFTLKVRAAGFGEAESGPLDGTAEDLAPVRVTLARLHAIEGKLTARASLPWEKVRVTVRRKNAGRTHTHRAEQDGTFRTDPLPAGDYELKVVFAHEGATWLGSAEAIAGAAGATDVHLRLEERSPAAATSPTQPTLPKWTVEVLGPDGKRVPRIAHRNYGCWPGQAPMYRGYSRGRQNPVTVSAQPQQTEEVWLEIFGAASERDRPLPYGAVLLTPRDLPVGGGAVTIRVPPERQVEGRLVDAAGEPVAGVTVQAFPRYDEERLPPASHDPHAEVRTSTQGAFRLRGLGDGTYELRAQVPGRFVPPDPVVVAAGSEDVEIRLRQAARVTVRVVDADGQPCANCAVSLFRAGADDPRGAPVGPVGYGATDNQGNVSFVSLDPERAYRLLVTPGQAATGVLPRTIEAWTPKDTEIELARGHAIAGVVVDEAGHPVPHAMVQVLTQPPSGWQGYYAEADGSFRIDRLPPGDATIRVTHRGHVYPYGEPERRVRAGDETLRLVVKSGGTLELALTDFEGEPWSVRSVAVTDPTDHHRYHVHCGFDASGKLLLTGLDPERRYALDVRHGELGFVRSGLAPGSKPVAVRLEAGIRLMVRVDVPGGLPTDRQWAQVQVTAQGNGWVRNGHPQPDGTGRFRIPAVPSLPCEVTGRLEAWRSDPAHPERPPTRQEPAFRGTATVERASEETVLRLHELAPGER